MSMDTRVEPAYDIISVSQIQTAAVPAFSDGGRRPRQ
jgi:hypothetical protein